MIANLPCWNQASGLLKRHCGGSRCGPYKELEVSLLGFSNRCRTLVCDLTCTRAVLMRECGPPIGIRAYKFLLDYTRIQVTSWMKDTAFTSRKQISQIIPRSCSRLFCDRFDATNCTYTPSN
uniref:Uncharacterized protein n=1 Tax=Panagrolaimus sp. ES5 TaxID=591445 RepID=A0AC34GA50_9BILA